MQFHPKQSQNYDTVLKIYIQSHYSLLSDILNNPICYNKLNITIIQS